MGEIDYLAGPTERMDGATVQPESVSDTVLNARRLSWKALRVLNDLMDGKGGRGGMVMAIAAKTVLTAARVIGADADALIVKAPTISDKRALALVTREDVVAELRKRREAGKSGS